MQVFADRIASANDGHSLPLAQYIDCRENLDPFAVRLNGQSYHDALRQDSGFPIVNALLLGGVDVNAQDSRSGETALHIAVSRPSRSNANPKENNNNSNSGDKDWDEEEDENGFGPPCRNARIISFLLDNGADANVRNAAGETPLMRAAAAGNTTALDILFAHGADVSLRDTIGRSALSYAASFPHVLQTMGAWVNDIAVRAAKEELLHVVCRRQGSEFAALFLIEQFGLNVNAREGENTMERENLANIEYKTSAPLGVHTITNTNTNGNGHMNTNMSVNEQTNVGTTSVSVGGGQTPLHYAILSGDESLVRALLLKGADMDRPDAFGVTPLLLATTHCGRHASILRLLRAFATAESAPHREALLRNHFLAATSLSEMNAQVDILYFFAAALLPHVALFVCVIFVPAPIWLLDVAALLIFLMLCSRVLLFDFRRRSARPLRGIGVFAGYAIAICGAAWYYIESYLDTVPCMFLLICAGLFVLCAWMVIARSPGFVESSVAQRAEFHRAFLRVHKGSCDESIGRGMDMRGMLRRPLRAQYCRQLDRIVLRYDRYCTWLSSAIGAGNHKPFIALLTFGNLLLAGLYVHTMYAGDILLTGGAQASALHRCATVYVSFLLPLALLVALALLAQQLWYISRGVTSYDVECPAARAPWCFSLGSRVYSLFDMGAAVNLRRFFLGEEDLAAQTHRMPVMSARLQRMARRFQSMQCMPCEDGHNHSHGGHNHSHGGHNHSHGGHNHSHGGHNHSHGGHNHSHGGHNHSYGEQNHSYGVQNHSYGEQNHSYGEQNHSYGVQNHSYGEQNHPYGEQNHSYGEQNHSYGEQNHSYGEQNHSYGEQNHSVQPPLHPPAFSPVSTGGAGAVAPQLFQLMVQHGSADIAAGPATESLRAGLTEAHWKESEAKAMEMFSFFQSNLRGGARA